MVTYMMLLETAVEQKCGNEYSWREHFDLPMREVKRTAPVSDEPVDWYSYWSVLHYVHMPGRIIF